MGKDHPAIETSCHIHRTGFISWEILIPKSVLFDCICCDLSSLYCHFSLFQSSFFGIVPCEEVTWCRITLSPSVALYVASDTHCDIWLGSRNEVSFCQTLKATKVAKFFMLPPLCSLVLEPDLDTGKKEKAQKWTGDEGGTAHTQLLSLLPKWKHWPPVQQSQGLNLKGNIWFNTAPLLSLWDLCSIMTASFLLQLTEKLVSPCSR